MAFAVKAEVLKRRASTFVFDAHKTMYGGKRIVLPTPHTSWIKPKSASISMAGR
jgi:hypothetical protein